MLSAAAPPKWFPQTTVSAKQEKTRNVMLNQGATVEELVRALTAIGSSPRDIIAILQNLKGSRRTGRRTERHLRPERP